MKTMTQIYVPSRGALHNEPMLVPASLESPAYDLVAKDHLPSPAGSDLEPVRVHQELVPMPEAVDKSYDGDGSKQPENPQSRVLHTIPEVS